MAIWAEPFTKLRVPKMFDLRADPYERADITSNTYYDWLFDHAYLVVPAQAYVAHFLGDLHRLPAGAAPGELLDRPDHRSGCMEQLQRRRRPVGQPSGRRPRRAASVARPERDDA